MLVDLDGRPHDVLRESVSGDLCVLCAFAVMHYRNSNSSRIYDNPTDGLSIHFPRQDMNPCAWTHNPTG